jgi:DNA-binding transcriptional MerR regulator
VVKAVDAFRTISEVAEDLDLPQHVLRFWETRFAQIKPMKRGGGRRYYRPEDVLLLRGIRALLYDNGFTIKGVQKILKDEGPSPVIALGSQSLDTGNTAAISLPQAQEEDGMKPVQLTTDKKKMLEDAFLELMECKRILEKRG